MKPKLQIIKLLDAIENGIGNVADTANTFAIKESDIAESLNSNSTVETTEGDDEA